MMQEIVEYINNNNIGRYLENESMSKHTTYRVGGKAKLFVYPKDKENITGYTYEPWHYRYVGKEIALYIKKHNSTYEEYYYEFIDI